MEVKGFWDKISRPLLFKMLMLTFKKEIVMEWEITDVAVTLDGEFLINWEKRFFPLTEQEYNEKYV